jgi:hypothetical protein
MGAIDRINIKNELIELGWKDVSRETDREHKMIPPECLWLNKRKYFDIYDARNLQELLENHDQEAPNEQIKPIPAVERL